MATCRLIWIGLLCLSAILVGCGTAPTPIIVYITTTPEPIETSVVRNVAAFPGPSPTPQGTPAPTDTPAPSAIPVTPSPTTAPVIPPDIPDNLPTLIQSRMGVQFHPFIDRDNWNQRLVDVAELGFDWIKIQIAWDEMEREPNVYNPIFYEYAQRIQWASYVAGPRKVLISIAKAPNWARPAGYNDQLDGPPANPDDLARFITTLLTLVKPEDNRITAIEIWNEPNLEREWNGLPMNGAEYMRLFAVAYNTIKSMAPNIQVITAGLAPVGAGVPGSVSDRAFLQQMYDAGLANYTDVKIGAHPFPWANPPDERCCNATRGWADNPVFFFQDTLFDYHDIIQRNRHATQIWVTEFGWGTYHRIGINGADAAPPDEAAFFSLLTEKQQAEYTIRAFQLLQQPPLSDFIEVAFLWNLNFAVLEGAIEQRQEQAGYSIFNASGQPRLIYFYLRHSPRQ